MLLLAVSTSPARWPRRSGPTAAHRAGCSPASGASCCCSTSTRRACSTPSWRTVTMGWIVLLQVGLLVLDHVRYDVSLPAARWVAVGLILVLQAYLLLAPTVVQVRRRVTDERRRVCRGRRARLRRAVAAAALRLVPRSGGRSPRRPARRGRGALSPARDGVLPLPRAPRRPGGRRQPARPRGRAAARPPTSGSTPPSSTASCARPRTSRPTSGAPTAPSCSATARRAATTRHCWRCSRRVTRSWSRATPTSRRTRGW